MLQFLKFSLVAVSVGGTTYAWITWRELDRKVRALVVGILVMTFIGAIPGFVDGLAYLDKMRKRFVPELTIPGLIAKPKSGGAEEPAGPRQQPTPKAKQKQTIAEGPCESGCTEGDCEDSCGVDTSKPLPKASTKAALDACWYKENKRACVAAGCVWYRVIHDGNEWWRCDEADTARTVQRRLAKPR